MAEKAKKTAKTNQNKNVIIGVCAAVIVAIIIVVAVILTTTNSSKINDSYFVSDGTKYVLTVEADDLAVEDGEINPVKAHIIYYYSGDAITGIKSYYEFADDATAQKAYFKYQEANSDGAYKEVISNGKYVIMVSNDSDYEGLTASDVKNQIELMEKLKNSNTNTTEETTTETTGTTE